MFNRVLNWVRRSFALIILISLFLPFVTVRSACHHSTSYGGWEAVGTCPLLLIIPVFAVSVVVLTFVGRKRVRTATGRFLSALLKALWTGMAAIVTWCLLHLLPDHDFPEPQWGGGLALASWAGIFVSDVIESHICWRDWARWKHANPRLPIEDPCLNLTGWSLYVTGGIPFFLAIAWQNVLLLTATDIVVGFILPLNAAFFTLALWWALACFTGWGLRRGLYWSFVLRHIVAAFSILLTVGVMLLVAGSAADLFRDISRPDLAGVGAALTATALLAWAVWNIGVVVLLRGWCRRFFPAKRVRLRTPEGMRKVLVPRCPSCRARLWFNRDTSQLVCRPCGAAHDAVIGTNAVKAVDAATKTA